MGTLDDVMHVWPAHRIITQLPQMRMPLTFPLHSLFTLLKNYLENYKTRTIISLRKRFEYLRIIKKRRILFLYDPLKNKTKTDS